MRDCFNNLDKSPPIETGHLKSYDGSTLLPNSARIQLNNGLVTSIEVKEYVKGLGVPLVGITTSERLRDLPTGSVEGVKILRGVAEELPSARSAIILGYRIWDQMFNLAVSYPSFRGSTLRGADEDFEWYQLYQEVVKNKAWQLASHLLRLGNEATVASGISLKPAAIKAGLGFRGKNTLVITPEHGPRVRFAAVLTSASLEPDEPFRENLCGECDKCIRACPTNALHPYRIEIKRCLTYAMEHPESLDVGADVRKLEKEFVVKPTRNSYVECTICQDSCPIGQQLGGHCESRI